MIKKELNTINIDGTNSSVLVGNDIERDSLYVITEEDEPVDPETPSVPEQLGIITDNWKEDEITSTEETSLIRINVNINNITEEGILVVYYCQRIVMRFVLEGKTEAQKRANAEMIMIDVADNIFKKLPIPR